MQENAGGGLKDLQSFNPGTAALSNEMYERDPGISAESKTGWKFLDPCGRKTGFLTQHCLSQGAGVSIILPTLPRKPWYCFPTANQSGCMPKPQNASQCDRQEGGFREQMFAGGKKEAATVQRAEKERTDCGVAVTTSVLNRNG